MADLITYCLMGIAFISVFEGLLYAAFPAAMKKILLNVIAMPLSSLRNSGVIMMLFGAILLWLVK